MRTKKIFFAGKYYSTFRKSLGIISIAVLFLFFVSCDVVDNDKKQGPPIIDPPIYPCPIKDISISSNGNYLLYFKSKVTKVLRDGSFEYIIDSTGIWKLNLNNRSEVLLFKSNWDSSFPQFIPSTQSILFNYLNHIVKMPFDYRLNDNNDLSFLTTIGSNFFPSINTDGNLIAYDSNVDSNNGMYFIWTMNVDGSNKKRITYEPQIGEIRMPSWFNSSNKIVHIRYVDDNDAQEIFIMSSTGNNSIRLTYNKKFDVLPRVNFTDEKILFISDRKLYSIDTSGTHLKQLSDFEVQSACWSPQDDIYFIKYNANKYNGENGTIWRMDENGQNLIQISNNWF